MIGCGRRPLSHPARHVSGRAQEIRGGRGSRTPSPAHLSLALVALRQCAHSALEPPPKSQFQMRGGLSCRHGPPWLALPSHADRSWKENCLVAPLVRGLEPGLNQEGRREGEKEGRREGAREGRSKGTFVTSKKWSRALRHILPLSRRRRLFLILQLAKPLPPPTTLSILPVPRPLQHNLHPTLTIHHQPRHHYCFSRSVFFAPVCPFPLPHCVCWSGAPGPLACTIQERRESTGHGAELSSRRESLVARASTLLSRCSILKSTRPRRRARNRRRNLARGHVFRGKLVFVATAVDFRSSYPSSTSGLARQFLLLTDVFY